jgi:hypothetical protein
LFNLQFLIIGSLLMAHFVKFIILNFIGPMIGITQSAKHIAYYFIKSDLGQTFADYAQYIKSDLGLCNIDHITQMVTISGITLSSFDCID